MASSLKLTPAELSLILGQVANRVTGLFPLHASGGLAIAETFEEWHIQRVDPSGPRIIELLARPTGRYHHQLHVTLESTSPKHIAAAWSELDLVGDRHVSQTSDTWTAGLIHAAIDAVDSAVPQIPDSIVARLLTLPAYRILAFWFPGTEGDMVYVISSLPGSTHVHPHRWMRGADFLAAVAVETVVVGVTP